LLLDKNTNEILAGYSAPDHPSYGNGGDYTEVEHPFPDYNPAKHHIIVVDKDTTNTLKSQRTRTRGILEIIHEDMEVGNDSIYEPLHTGKFLTEDGDQMIEEKIMSLPAKISCKKLRKKK